MKIDLSTWLTKKQACKRLEVSPRTLHRMMSAGKIERRARKVPGRCPEAVYNPDDVEACAALNPSIVSAPASAEGNGFHESLPVVATPLHPALVQTALLFERIVGPVLEQNRQLIEEMKQALHAVSRALPSAAPETAPVERKLYLTIDEAMRYSGLTQGALRRFVRSGTIVSIRDYEGTKISRVSLESLAAQIEPPLLKEARMAKTAGGPPCQ